MTIVLSKQSFAQGATTFLAAGENPDGRPRRRPRKAEAIRPTGPSPAPLVAHSSPDGGRNWQRLTIYPAGTPAPAEAQSLPGVGRYTLAFVPRWEVISGPQPMPIAVDTLASSPARRVVELTWADPAEALARCARCETCNLGLWLPGEPDRCNLIVAPGLTDAEAARYSQRLHRPMTDAELEGRS